MGLEGQLFETVAAFIDAHLPLVAGARHTCMSLIALTAAGLGLICSADSWMPQNRLARDLVGISRALVV